MEFERRKRMRTHLNIAPLIDVVFLLIIFLMLSSHFVAQPGIKITLPTAVGTKLHPEENITILVAGDGNIYLNERAVALDGLLLELKEKIGTSQKKTVIIRADEKIDFGLAVRVIDTAQRAGAEGLVVQTKKEGNGN